MSSRWISDELRPAFERLLSERPPAAGFEDDAALAFAALEQHAPAVAELEARLDDARPHVARVNGSAAFFDEVRQQVLVRLLAPGSARLREYSAQGPLRAWLRAVAVRLAIDVQRKEGKTAPEEELGTFIRANALHADPLRQLTAQRVSQAIRASLEKLPARDKTLLRLHYLEGATLEALAGMYSAHRATVARWLADARAFVLQQTRVELQSALGGDELDSAMDSVASLLDVSFRQLIAE